MATATIQVKYLNPPRNGNPKASWSIKDEHGSYWGIYPDKVGKPEVGSTITVEWKGREYQGREYKDITAILGTSGDTGPTAPRPSNGSAPAGNGNGAKDMHIFVCGVINSAIKAGVLHIDANALTDAGEAAKQAYRNLFGLSVHN